MTEKIQLSESQKYNTNIMFLDIFHRPVFISNHDVSETGFCLRIQVEDTQLSPVGGRIDEHLNNCKALPLY
jgi:hypothetical protein